MIVFVEGRGAAFLFKRRGFTRNYLAERREKKRTDMWRKKYKMKRDLDRLRIREREREGEREIEREGER